MTFAEWLDEQMGRKNLSISDLARAVKASPATVSAWRAQRREPVPETIRRLASLFDVPAQEVINLTKWREA